MKSMERESSQSATTGTGPTSNRSPLSPIRSPELIACPHCQKQVRVWMWVVVNFSKRLHLQQLIPHIFLVEKVEECRY